MSDSSELTAMRKAVDRLATVAPLDQIPAATMQKMLKAIRGDSHAFAAHDWRDDNLCSICCRPREHPCHG